METVTELLIDFSGSMKEKLLLTKKILLEEIIPNLDYSSRIGVKTFASINKMPPFKQVLDLNIINKEEIVNCVYNLGTPEGGTPLSAAINASVKTLGAFEKNEKQIILITDGNEDDGGDFVAEAKKAKSAGKGCQIHIIGIGLDEKSKAQAREISKITNGTFSFLPYTKNYYYDTSNVKSYLLPFYAGVNPKNSPLNDTMSTILDSKQLELVESNGAQNFYRKNIEPLKEINTFSANDTLMLLMEEIKSIKTQVNELQLSQEKEPANTEQRSPGSNLKFAAGKYMYENVLQKKYPSRVRWLNEVDECSAGHDFEIFDFDGSVEYFIVCKASVNDDMEMVFTKNEWHLFLSNVNNFQVYFIRNLFSRPTYIRIDNMMDWILKGKLVPYSKQTKMLKEEMVFLTITA